MTRLCKPLIKKCCIAGLGLIGGSLGMALGRFGVAEERWGYDVKEQAMNEARERGAVDQTGPLLQGLCGADLVILSMPVRQILSTLEEISPFLAPGALLTDVGSTKQKIVEAMEIMLPPGVTGIGGHPMAGLETAGIDGADPDLLKGAAYLLTPTPSTPKAELEKLREIISAIKARPFILDAKEHDRLVALISHLPQMVASALVGTLKNYVQERELLLALAAKGFRDTTRLAMGDPDMWYDIYTTNKKFLKESLQIFQKELNFLFTLVENKEEKEAKEILTEIQLLRRAFS